MEVNLEKGTIEISRDEALDFVHAFDSLTIRKQLSLGQRSALHKFQKMTALLVKKTRDRTFAASEVPK